MGTKDYMQGTDDNEKGPKDVSVVEKCPPTTKIWQPPIVNIGPLLPAQRAGSHAFQSFNDGGGRFVIGLFKARISPQVRFPGGTEPGEESLATGGWSKGISSREFVPGNLPMVGLDASCLPIFQ